MRFRHLLVALLAGLLAVAAPALTTSASAAPGEGSAFGYVYDDFAGGYVDSATVTIWASADYPDGPPVDVLTTDTNGFWSTSSLPIGSYNVAVGKPDFVTAEQVVTLTDGNNSYVNTNLKPDTANWGTLTGSVTIKGSAARYGCGWVRIHEASSAFSTSIATGSQGRWSVQVPAGSYTIELEDDCGNAATRWAPNSETEDDAATYVVASRATTAVPAVDLPRAAQVSGTVTNQGGQAIQGIRVDLTDAGNEWNSRTTYTDAAGRYTFSDITASNRKLRFSDDYVGEYLSEWHSDQTSFANATQFSVASQDVTGMDAVLEANLASMPEAALAGYVTDANGKPIRGLQVSLEDVDGNWMGSAYTNTAGRYQFARADVSKGDYRLEFYGELRSDEDWPTFADQWYRGKQNPYSAQVVTVGATGTTTLPGVKMVRLGTVSGKVILPELPNSLGSETFVMLFDADGSPVNMGGSGSQLDTDFIFGGVQPGRYFVRAYGAQATGDPSTGRVNGYHPYVSSWWKAGHSIETATPIMVSPGGKVTGININLTRALKSVVAPKISGKAKKGKKLTTSAGVWNQAVDVTFSYTWKRGKKVVGTTSTYKAKKADQGKLLTVTVKASHVHGELIAGSATTKAVKVAKGKKQKKKRK